jgi:hypothetical protein
LQPVAAEHPGALLITDKGFAGREFERVLTEEHRVTLLRPSRKDEAARFGEPILKSVRQLIESVNDTLKGQLDLEQHGARSFEGVAIWPSASPGASSLWPRRSGTTSGPDRRPAGH